jgi:hypothetical protein
MMRTKIPKPGLVAAVLFAGVVLAACGGGGSGGDGTPTPSGRPSSPAKLSILEPEPNQVFGPDHVPVRVRLTGATLTKVVSTTISPTKGHIHLRLDGQTITLLAGLDEDVVKIVGHPLKPGPHLLEVEFVASDHGPFIPRILSSVTFTVR